MAGEWVVHGTALSPPLAPMVLQAFATFLVYVRRRVGVVGELGLAVIGAAYVIGGLGEPFVPPGSALPDALHVALAIAGVALAATMVILAVRELVRRWWLRRTVSGS